MNRFIRMRRFYKNKWENLLPQAMTDNILRYEDGGVLTEYLDRYDAHLNNTMMHFNRATSTGTYEALNAVCNGKVLVDGFPLLLTLHTGIECEPTLTFNGGDPLPIVSGNGEGIPGGQNKGSVLFLIYSETNKAWILMSNDIYSDVTKVVLPVENEYVYTAIADGEETITIPGFDKKADKIVINYSQTILRLGLEFEYVETADDTIHLIGFSLNKGEQLLCYVTSYITTTRRGRIQYDLISKDYTVETTADNTTEIVLPAAAKNAHSILVNYQQTILRNNLDYTYNTDKDKITLTKIALDKGEKVTFTITTFEETNGDIVPNNWGATGNYRYSLDVVHTEYTATENNITVIPIPDFDPRKDDISVIRDNKLFVFDVDYTIDEVGQVVLLKSHLDTNDSIYFTILKGAMIDVPNFNVIDASGTSAQHLLLNFSYRILCDFYCIVVRLKYNLRANPTIKCIDGPAEPVCDCYGNPITGGYAAGAFLWLVYNQDQKCWYSLSHGKIDISTLVPTFKVDKGEATFSGGRLIYNENQERVFAETVINHKLGVVPTKIEITPSEPPTITDSGLYQAIGDIWSYADVNNLYVGNTGASTSKFRWVVSTEDTTNDLRSYIDQEITAIRKMPGNIITKQVAYTVPADNTTTIDPIENFDSSKDKLLVNFNQTVLRKDIDYTITETNGIALTSIKLSKNDIIQFTIFIQE